MKFLAFNQVCYNFLYLIVIKHYSATTGITQYENNELTIFATDFAISERIQTISGTPNKGVTLTIRLANKAPDCENDEQEIELDIVPQKRPAVAGCDISQSNTHNHEFEVIMKKVNLQPYYATTQARI